MRPSRAIVVAGVIEAPDGRILACQRKKGHRHELKWEFPGGKLEAGENPAEALRRELSEELGIDAEIGKEMARYEFSYQGKPPIELIFFSVHEFRGEIRNQVFEQMRWCEPKQLVTLDFLEGDIDFVRRLPRLQLRTGG
ncbi:MAG: (deoxy)nucleoside triphosphate pyrophosphohydrolase [Acidobacteria bacterium]|nr:(deoxy)nucleoside triphosphate pyrophosphohydrolase [Acidobacteriota bacterium]